MQLEIRPEPSESEREALERALAQALPPPEEPRGRWWRVGVEENLVLELVPE